MFEATKSQLLIVTIIYQIVMAPFLFAKECFLNSEALEVAITERVYQSELSQMSHRDLLEAYDTGALKTRMETVHKILESLHPYRKGIDNLNAINRHRAARDKVKAVEALIELGMTKSEANKAVNKLLGNPHVFQKLFMLLTHMTASMERQSINKWIIRATVLLSAGIILGPGTITQAVVLIKQGIFVPIPLVNYIEGGMILGLVLWGGKGYRIVKNALTRMNEYGYEKQLFHESDYQKGKKPFKEVQAKDVEWIFRTLTANAIQYQRFIHPYIAPVADPIINRTKAVGAVIGKGTIASLNAIKALVLEMSIILHMSKTDNIDTVMRKSLIMRDYVYKKPYEDYRNP